MSTTLTIVTSAAVGALASSGITFIGQLLERRARRRELLLEKAVEIAISRRDFALNVASQSGRPASFIDEAVAAAEYYKALDHLLKKGKLPEGFEKK